jgi:hypothetical protein
VASVLAPAGGNHVSVVPRMMAAVYEAPLPVLIETVRISLMRIPNV